MANRAGKIVDRCQSATKSETVVPGTNFVMGECRGIYVGTGGDVEVVDIDGDAVVYPNVASSFILPVEAIQVKDTNTTAEDMVAMK